LNLCYSTEVYALQNYITGVLTIVMIETATWYFDYRHFNNTGIRDYGVMVFGMLVSVCRMTVSRMLVIAVSLGFGVVKPTLGKNTYKILLLGSAYLIVEFVLEMLTRYGQTHEIKHFWKLVWTLPAATLNAIAYWWIFVSLYRVSSHLLIRKQFSKLQLYKRLGRVLVFSLTTAIIFAVFQMYFLATSGASLHWSIFWFVDGGFSLLLYSLILLSIAFLWRPSKDSHRFAYAPVARGEEEADEEEFGLEAAQLDDRQPDGPVRPPEGNQDNAEQNKDSADRAGIVANMAAQIVQDDANKIE